MSDKDIKNDNLEEDLDEKEAEKADINPKDEKQPDKKDKNDEAKEYLERLQRTMAEFDNFRKRTAKEKSQMFESGAKEVLEVLLPVIDNFERALSSCDEDAKEDNKAFVQGVEMIYKQLIGVLEEVGVKEIDAVGKEFDPNFHNAVTHVEDDELGENIVAEEFQKGYMYKDSVLRYSMVKVAN